MRVGMYNRYLATLGGGERLSLAIAEYLGEHHPVTVISHGGVAKSAVEKRFDLDLSRVELLDVPRCSARDMTPVTSGYDLFMNVTDQMYFPSLAPTSVNLVYFPAAIFPPSTRGWRQRVKTAVHHLFGLPAVVEGLRRVEHDGAAVSWVVDSPATLRLPVGPKGCQLRFSVRLETPSAHRVDLYLDGEQVDSAALAEPRESASFQVRVPGSAGGFRELTLRLGEAETASPSPARLRLGRLALDRPRHRLYRRWVEPVFRDWAWRLNCDLPKTWIVDDLETYDAIWAVSEYSRRWIRSYWDRESHVLYPPVDPDSFRVDVKKERILSVGRFFAGRHNKKHLEMIEAFREMVDGGLSGWELHLVGGSTPGPEHQEYLRQVRRRSEGYPVVVHVDLAFEPLADLYAGSAIYWHATGCGEDVGLTPDRFEHFGITTLEAMASGCVPVVLAEGGLPEIVQPGVSGFLWQTPVDLCSRTRQLIENPELVRKTSAAALARCRRFDKDRFRARLRELLGLLGL